MTPVQVILRLVWGIEVIRLIYFHAKRVTSHLLDIGDKIERGESIQYNKSEIPKQTKLISNSNCRRKATQRWN